jgi:hypothetical protein
VQLSGIQQCSAAQLRALIASLPGAARTQFLTASSATTHANSFDFAGHETPLADDDLAGWRIAAATMLARATIHDAVGQLATIDRVVIADDGPDQSDGARSAWHEIEYWLGKPAGSLTANTTGFVDDDAPETNMARIVFPRSAVDAASRAADLLNRAGATVTALPAADQRALQLYTSTAPHEAIHAATYTAPRLPTLDWHASTSVSAFTEGLAEAATEANYRRFSDRILGSAAGYLDDATRFHYGYPQEQLEPMRRIAALSGAPARGAQVLLRNPAAVRIGQQAQSLVHEVAPGATSAQAHALVTSAVDLARARAQRTADATAAATEFDAALDAIVRHG